MNETVCHVCGGHEVLPFQELLDASGAPMSVQLCVRCCSLLPSYPERVVEDALTVKNQAEFHARLWSEFGTAEAEQLRREVQGVVEFYQESLGAPSPDQLVVEIGAGRGALLAALRHAGYAVAGCEPSEELAAKGRQAYGLSEQELANLPGQDFLAQLASSGRPVGAVILWHVIEHVADPVGLLRTIARMLAPGRAMVLQVPALRSEYLFPEHLMLLTEPSIYALARNCGCEVARVDWDHTLGYIGFVLRRTEQPVPEQWVGEPRLGTDGALLHLTMQRHRLQQRLAQQDRELTAAHTMAAERMIGIERQSVMLMDRDKWVVDLQGRLSEQQLLAAQREALLADKAREIADRDREIAELRGLAQSLEERIAERDCALAEQTKTGSMVKELMKRLAQSGKQS